MIGDESTRVSSVDRADAVLPSISSLRTIRELLKEDQTPPPTRRSLLVLADPDFAGTGKIPADTSETQAHGARGAALGFTSGPGFALGTVRTPTARSVMRDGSGDPLMLAKLPTLPGTLVEGRDLARLMAAHADDLLLGPAASETAIRQRQAAGQLTDYRIIAFSTHGLVSGDFASLTEPALALAHPQRGSVPAYDDGLLKASEVATLSLDADWVVLSACNTTSTDGNGGEGLSGLARAFFSAGARAILASHWRLRDDAAQRLVSDTVAGLQSRLGKAKSLREAMLKLMADTTYDLSGFTYAAPQAWAPFVLVGEPD